MNRRQFLACAAAAPLAIGATPGAVVDTDGMMLVDGKRTFALGSYYLPNGPNGWERAKDAGFRFIHVGGKKEELDKAAELGMKTWISVGSIKPASRADDEERIRKVVTEFRNHPALLFWETEDEPSYIWNKPEARIAPEVIRDTYRFIRTLDPKHAVYLNQSPTNLVSTLRKYNPGGDLIATDIYPVIPHGIRTSYALWEDGRQGDFPNAYISQVGQYADKMRAVAGPNRAVFMVLQAFAWENLREKDRDPKMILYPTRAQLRFMQYQTIAHGANGIVYWGLTFTPAGHPFWDDLASVNKELKSIADALAARPIALPLKKEYHDTGHSLDRGIEWIAKPAADGVLLIAVNADSNPVDVTLSGLSKFRSVETLFQTTDAKLVQGTLRDRFEPFDSRVWKLKP
ncbi:MAG: hypothetical protein NTY38_26650 [Acidobacteria bacterium]|nr:hypothetical protein [Acidobacteriota bacterium]